MAKKKFHLRVITPKAVKVEKDVEMVIMRCTTGDMGIMANHQPYSAALIHAPLRILDEGSERILDVHGGIAEIENNVLTVISGQAEWVESVSKF